MDVQLKRGLLEICVLTALQRGDSYDIRSSKIFVLPLIFQNLPCIPF